MKNECYDCGALKDLSEFSACDSCGGTGWNNCPKCNGLGTTDCPACERPEICKECGGSGKFKCNDCEGIGKSDLCQHCADSWQCARCNEYFDAELNYRVLNQDVLCPKCYVWKLNCLLEEEKLNEKA